ncbi:MAG: class I SAM-dependent methyltransferase [Planctomycetaceae bacterium]
MQSESQPGSGGDPLPTGADTMSPAMRDMQAYPRYLFRCVQRYLGDRVWEIGVGYGTYTAMLREIDRQVLATDIDPACLDAVRNRFVDDDAVRAEIVDLTDEASVRAIADFRADSIVCFNVLEHIEDDIAALRWMKDAVAPHAMLALIVPAHQWLFGKMDSEAGHFRRYSRRRAAEALRAAGWIVHRTRYLNMTGAAGWWYHNRCRNDAGLADDSVNRQMRSADRWLPRLARVTDPLFGFITGLSVMAIGKARPD